MSPPPEYPSDDLPEIVLVSASEIGSGALEAHLGELARRLSAHGRVHWAALWSPRLLLDAAGRRCLETMARRARASLSGRLLLLPHGPRLVGLSACGMGIGLALRAAGVGAGAILHGRGHLGALAAVAARRVLPGSRVIHDVRSDRPAEVRAHGGERAPGVVARLEGVACRRSDAHLAVSRPLAAILRRRHGVEALVLPSAADTESFHPHPAARARIRAALGLEDEPLVGFVGSFSPWQKPDGIVAAFRALRRLRPSARLLILSPDQDAWERFVAGERLAADVPGRPDPRAPVLIRQAPHDEVSAWMNACDLTLLLRDDDDVNRVASPIKFGESLACGVPVLVSRCVTDAAALVQARGTGAVVGDPLLRGEADLAALASLVQRIETDRDALRRACREAAVQEWSWTAQMPMRLDCYRRLAAGAAPAGGGLPTAGRAPAPGLAEPSERILDPGVEGR